jgi:hypothetical protein
LRKIPSIRIFTIRGQKVVLDAHLARVYGVTSKALNQGLRRNKRKFPADFAFQVSSEEYDAMRSQIVTTSSEAEDMRSQIVTGSESPNWSQIATTSKRNMRYRRGSSRNMARCRQRTFCEAIVRLR